MGQAHIFGAAEEVMANTEFAELQRLGKLHVHADSLSAVLNSGAEAGLVRLGFGPEGAEMGRAVHIKGEASGVPLQLWNQCRGLLGFLMSWR